MLNGCSYYLQSEAIVFQYQWLEPGPLLICLNIMRNSAINNTVKIKKNIEKVIITDTTDMPDMAALMGKIS